MKKAAFGFFVGFQCFYSIMGLLNNSENSDMTNLEKLNLTIMLTMIINALLAVKC